jgi:hypothetical protein
MVCSPALVHTSATFLLLSIIYLCVRNFHINVYFPLFSYKPIPYTRTYAVYVYILILWILIPHSQLDVSSAQILPTVFMSGTKRLVSCFIKYSWKLLPSIPHLIIFNFQIPAFIQDIPFIWFITARGVYFLPLYRFHNLVKI